jgi:hypothetical protein
VSVPAGVLLEHPASIATERTPARILDTFFFSKIIFSFPPKNKYINKTDVMACTGHYPWGAHTCPAESTYVKDFIFIECKCQFLRISI